VELGAFLRVLPEEYSIYAYSVRAGCRSVALPRQR
jgi:hypothetical protein